MDRPGYGNRPGYLRQICQARAKRAGPAIEAHGGRFLARGGRHETLEGRDHARNVVVEFASLEDAIACYNSPAYQEALTYALKSAEREVAIVEGV